MLRLPARNTQGMDAIATCLAELLETGDVMLLAGPVGAGKTTLVAGICTALGTDEPATSPTYTIGQLYTARDGRSVGHLDLYRGAPTRDAEWADLDRYLSADLVFMEWPAGVPAQLAHRPVWTVAIDHVDHAHRAVGIAAPAPERQAPLMRRAPALVAAALGTARTSER